MLVNATEKNQAAQAAVAAGTGRFARDPAEYATATGIRLQVVDGTAAGPTLPATTGAAACARLIILPVFFSFLFFSRAEKKKKGPDRLTR